MTHPHGGADQAGTRDGQKKGSHSSTFARGPSTPILHTVMNGNAKSVRSRFAYGQLMLQSNSLSPSTHALKWLERTTFAGEVNESRATAQEQR
jgi:hypothetical protein